MINGFVYAFFKAVPMLILFSIVYLMIRFLSLTKKNYNLFYEICFYVFCIYLILLYHIVTFPDVDWSTSNFIPMKEIFRYHITSPLFFKNVFGNIFLFFPFGFFLFLLFQINKKQLFCFTFLFSLSIELVQLKIGRVFDLDDIFLNGIGSFFGYIICFYFQDIYRIKFD